MRKNNGLVFAVILNALLLIHFSYRNAQSLQQIKALGNEITEFEEKKGKLYSLRNEMNTSTKQVSQILRSNYVRLKEMTEYTRRYQIRIKGISEDIDENLFQSVKEVGEHMDIPISEKDVSRITRVGISSKKASPRVVMVELSDLKLKAKLLAKASTALLNTPYSIQDDVTNHVMPSTFAEVEERDFSQSCGYITAVSEPSTVAKSKTTFGAWLQDYEIRPNGNVHDYIWILPHFYENNVVEEYTNINKLKHRRIQKKYQLPYDWAGTGHVVLRGCLYFIKFGTNVIVRYEFASKSILKEKSIPKALYGNDAPYQWSGSTDIDLSVDNTGFYAIYATYENTMDIVIGRIDPVSLELLQTWKTNWRKQWSGNAFMMCGVLYVLKKYDEGHTMLSYTYDTKIKRYRRAQIPFTNKYEWNTMLEYNYRQKLIYAWDRGYLVTYNITTSKTFPSES